MKNKIIYLMGLCVLLGLSSCSTMNSEFSCNKTAKDSCLSIEEVDAMTRFADNYDEKNSTNMSQVQKEEILIVPQNGLNQHYLLNEK